MKRIEVTEENSLAALYPEIAVQWHPGKNGELTPDKVRVETTLRPWWRCGEGHEWRAKTTARIAGLGCPVCQESGTYIRGKNDLETLCPGIAAQWHPEKNGTLRPADVSAQSNRKVWWMCEKGHEWQAFIQGRVVQNSRCPYCTGRRMIKGVNDLAALFPEVAAEWDYDTNDKLPEDYKPTCPEKVFWVCSEGHRWKTSIEKRTSRGQGCPYCSGRDAVPGETDIITINPEVMKYWDYAKNTEAGIRPEDVKPHSDKWIWCRCDRGHSWRVRAKKLVRGDRCPYCRNQKIIPGENDFASLAPAELLAEWHPARNTTVKPDGIALHYGRKVWWLCSKGHEWRTSPDGRLRGNPFTGCPYCTGIYVVIGETDLKTKAPELMDEYSARNRKGPEELNWQSVKKVWWRCRDCGYEWMARVYSRTRHGTGCPKCHGKR